MSNREIFIEKLRQLSKEEMLERYIALLNTEKLTDYVADLEAKLALTEKQLELTQKALELSYEHHKKESMPANWIYHITKEEYLIYFKQQAEKYISNNKQKRRKYEPA